MKERKSCSYTGFRLFFFLKKERILELYERIRQLQTCLKSPCLVQDHSAFVLTIMSGLSQFERDLISPGMNAGLASAKARASLILSAAWDFPETQ